MDVEKRVLLGENHKESIHHVQSYAQNVHKRIIPHGLCTDKVAPIPPPPAWPKSITQSLFGVCAVRTCLRPGKIVRSRTSFSAKQGFVLQAHHSGIFPDNITHTMLFYKRIVDRVLSEIGLLSNVLEQHERREQFRKRMERQREENFIGALFDSWSMPSYPP